MFFIICSWFLEVGKEAYVKVYDRGTGLSFSPSLPSQYITTSSFLTSKPIRESKMLHD